MDEEPRGIFSIDKFTGKVSLNAVLDREKTDRFRVGPAPPRPTLPLPSLPLPVGAMATPPPAKPSILNWGAGVGFGTGCPRKQVFRITGSFGRCVSRLNAGSCPGGLGSRHQGGRQPSQESNTRHWCGRFSPEPATWGAVRNPTELAAPSGSCPVTVRVGSRGRWDGICPLEALGLSGLRERAVGRG